MARFKHDLKAAATDNKRNAFVEFLGSTKEWGLSALAKATDKLATSSVSGSEWSRVERVATTFAKSSSALPHTLPAFDCDDMHARKQHTGAQANLVIVAHVVSIWKAALSFARLCCMTCYDTKAEFGTCVTWLGRAQAAGEEVPNMVGIMKAERWTHGMKVVIAACTRCQAVVKRTVSLVVREAHETIATITDKVLGMCKETTLDSISVWAADKEVGRPDVAALKKGWRLEQLRLV